MSKPKINYHKSEMVTLGMEEEEQDLVANMLNCKVGMMPITYLGFPISDRYIGIQAFRGMNAKIRNKLQPWKGENMSFGGRIMLTDTSLSSQPTYLMGMFYFKRRNSYEMDNIRSYFFGGGDISKF